MKKLQGKVMQVLVKAIPVLSVMALIVNANSTASPINGQPASPSSMKKYRKF
jgi:hypothetical protein